MQVALDALPPGHFTCASVKYPFSLLACSQLARHHDLQAPSPLTTESAIELWARY